jgi:hypothetical protein
MEMETSTKEIQFIDEVFSSISKSFEGDKEKLAVFDAFIQLLQILTVGYAFEEKYRYQLFAPV